MSPPPFESSARARSPRRAVRVGNASINASDLKGLRAAFVLELLFEQGTRRLGGMWPHYRRAVASWMTDYFQYDPLVLARMAS
jgi:hypothetical protein